ncbi:Hsp33 family molecular chaperone HslO [Amylibacter sp. IMCC11727]|mgnify:CR=1 FL=1|uniref:Hsp33 family molecular chaperone HslO n=1 Tax=Amylibacter sp. IMCC11727 TaxID=3039851 RepID=UPI00244E30E8|nr:Hsp33 family molecular chaperone HslO [Amylibacter sp. IMCC11727]WGI21947.1 Hsp33 family molecular chaperone HslO [Amylibacter sp. IMCC11727]
MQSDQTNKRWDDTILPFQLDAVDVRGRVARLDTTLDTILSQHNYPLTVSAQVAEAALLTALIGQTISLRWKLSLQIRGNGPLRIIATDYFAPKSEAEPARIRAYASFDADAIAQSDQAGFDLIGKGMFAILIDQGEGTTPYQGITPLAGGSLSKCAETYFAQSEQLPTQFKTIAAQETAPDGQNNWRAGGIMIQHMPKASPLMDDGGTGEGGLLQAQDLVSEEDAENWNRATILMESAEEIEMIGPHVGQEQLLRRLFHQEIPRVFPAQPIEFGCTCGEDKVRNTMSIYSAKDIAKMTTEQGMVTADCQFCGAHYELEPSTLGKDAQNDG